MKNTIKKNTIHKFGLKHFLFSSLMLLSVDTACAEVEIYTIDRIRAPRHPLHRSLLRPWGNS